MFSIFVAGMGDPALKGWCYGLRFLFCKAYEIIFSSDTKASSCFSIVSGPGWMRHF